MFVRHELFSDEVALGSHTSAVGISSAFSHTAPWFSNYPPGRNDTSATPMPDLFGGGIPQGFALFEGFRLLELLRATAWRTSALKADSSTSSPSWMSIARRTFPSRLELKRRAGSFRDALLEKVSFTTFLYDSPV